MVNPRGRSALKRHGRVIVVGVVGVLLFGLRTGMAEEPLSRFEFHRKAMGVDFTVVLYGAKKGAANSAATAALDRITQIDSICSDYQASSELRRLCARAKAGQVMPISHDLARVLERAQQIAKRSGGAFDVTVGPLTKLWRRARRKKQLPPRDRFRQARELVGYRLLEVDGRGRTLILKRAGMQLDLGGIAKGYAVDRAMEVLALRGFTRSLVDGSGDLAVGDPPPGRKGWKVEVESLAVPGKDGRESAVLLELHREEEAETEIHRAIHLAQRDDQDRTLAGLRINLGLLRSRRGELLEAISEFELSRNIAAETGAYEAVAMI